MEMSQGSSCRAILNKQKYFFSKNREQNGKTAPVWGLVPVHVGDIRKEYSGNIMYSCMEMET
jgi:hypothetical protein